MKVSVITINYNNVNGLLKTLKSVDTQSFVDYELIVVDGGSTDGSVDVIREFVRENPSLHWVSEHDNGIYNAMNKGVRMSSGDYCIFMNSGDCFYDKKSLTDSAKFLDGTVDIVSGASKQGEIYKRAPSEQDLTLTFFIRDAMNHQSTFIKRQLLLDCPYDEGRKIAGDSEFFFRSLILNNVTYCDMPVCVSLCEKAGVSGNLIMSIDERIKAIKDVLPARMYYDVDFIKMYHNGFFLKIGRIIDILRLRKICYFINHIIDIIMLILCFNVI